MGSELFDAALKEYAVRWAFKHPKPADFFRTMEDASAVDLDWFWKGWFFSTDYVDVSVSDVKWFKLRETNNNLEGKLGNEGILNIAVAANEDFSNGPREFSMIKTPNSHYEEFLNRIDDSQILEKYRSSNFYEVRLENKGGLVTPIILKFYFVDGTSETQILPAEIWRKNEEEITKVFVFDKEVVKIILDQDQLTGDTEIDNNEFPKKTESKSNKFKNNY